MPYRNLAAAALALLGLLELAPDPELRVVPGLLVGVVQLGQGLLPGPELLEQRAGRDAAAEKLLELVLADK